MLAKTSKEVTDRQRDCHFLTTALHNQGPRISNQLLEQVRPHLLEGDVDPTAEPMQVAMARALDANMRDTVAADEAMFYANARLDELRIELARTFEAQCRLAGETELAERVRRSTSRRQAEEVEEVSGEEEETVAPSDEVAPSAELGTAAV